MSSSSNTFCTGAAEPEPEPEAAAEDRERRSTIEAADQRADKAEEGEDRRDATAAVCKGAAATRARASTCSERAGADERVATRAVV
jgi:hypothetical protein